MSTPFGRRGWFWQAWSEGGHDWQRFEIPAVACPRISRDFLEQEKRSLPPSWFASEYGCLFVQPDDSFFDQDDVLAAIDSGITPLFLGGT